MKKQKSKKVTLKKYRTAKKYSWSIAPFGNTLEVTSLKKRGRPRKITPCEPCGDLVEPCSVEGKGKPTPLLIKIKMASSDKRWYKDGDVFIVYYETKDYYHVNTNVPTNSCVDKCDAVAIEDNDMVKNENTGKNKRIQLNSTGAIFYVDHEDEDFYYFKLNLSKDGCVRKFEAVVLEEENIGFVGPCEMADNPSKGMSGISLESGITGTNKALRYNSGKLKWALVHFKSLEPMVRVLEAGALKYAPENWKKPMDKKEILECAQRHLAALMDGEELDPETGESHAGHILCNCMFYIFHSNKSLK